MPSPTPIFSAQLLGQTEKAANAILDRLLVEPGLSEAQWITLSITVNSGATLDRDRLTARAADALKVGRPEAHTHIAALVAAGLLDVPDDGGGPATLTETGHQLHSRVRAAVTEITERLWSDLPVEDLATAGRVLSTVLARANAELA
jgi:DNA-binding MarR family transcriptional regulator